MLRQCLGIPHISTGDMLRESIQRGSLAGKSLAALMHAGSLVPDEIVNGMVRERLSQPDAGAGFILDGYPRTRAQAEHLCTWLKNRGFDEVVIHLAVDYNIIIARLTGRRQCPRCGTLYNIVSNPPKVPGLCDRDGEKLVIREDDSEAVIRERLEEYEQLTRPLLNFYRSAGKRVIEFDGSSEAPEMIGRKICQALDVDDRTKDAR